MADYTREKRGIKLPRRKDRKRTMPMGSGEGGLKVLSKKGVIRLFSDPQAEAMEALAELESNGYCPNYSGGAPLEDKCIQTISALGFAMVDDEELSPGIEGTLKKYTLKGSTNIDETIENSTIVDPDLELLTPIKHSAADKFKDPSDSFYDLDQERPDYAKKEVEKYKQKDKKASLLVAKKLAQITRKSHNKMLEKQNKRDLKR